MKQADLVELALRELEQTEFLRTVAAVEWDDEAVAEAQEWDEAEVSGPMDPWDPRR